MVRKLPVIIRRITLREGNGFEDVSGRITAAHVDSEPSTWNGRLATFVQVAEQNRAQLLWLAQRMTPDRGEAEDTVQEALLRAFRNLRSLQNLMPMCVSYSI
jgi:hypothetical protein